MTATDDALRQMTDRLTALDAEDAFSFEREAKEHIAALQATVDAQSAELARLRGMGWQPIETAQEGKQYIVGWMEGDEERQDFDYFEDGFWHGWEDHYQHFCTVALSGCGQVSGPRETPPYTHCIELQPLPAALASRNGGGGV